jgi:PHD/YefM family antitoxin component YafN of YafNO toxin-antitoxin module
MNDKIVSAREIQRNYRKLVDRVKETGQAIYLGAGSKPEAVLLNVEAFESLKEKAMGKKMDWKKIKRKLDLIAGSGKQGISLSEFIHEDRQRH